MAEQPLYAFNQSDAKALVQLIGSRNPLGTPAVEPNAMPMHIGTASTTITARNGSTLGSGTVQFKYINSSNVLVNDITVTVLNLGSAIASGAHVLCFRTGGNWLAVEVC